MNCRSRLFVNKGFYNRYVADVWMWMIFFEWAQKCISHYSTIQSE